MGEQAAASASSAPTWRLTLGAGLFVLGLIIQFLGIPIVMALGLSAAMKASISGAFMVVGEISTICSVAVMGKPGYLYIKRLLSVLLKRYGPPQEVGRVRYTAGLVLFWVPVLFGWLSVYFAKQIPGFGENPIPYAIVGDAMLVAGLLVLGGGFWDKVRSLFVHGAEAHFPRSPKRGDG